MRREVFEKAAFEANFGLDQVDAELQQLEARKQTLLANREVLQGVGRQMAAVLSMISAGGPTKFEALSAHSEVRPAGDTTLAQPPVPASQYAPYSVREEAGSPLAPAANDDLRKIVGVGN
jgi:hypothetical protein